MISNPEYLVIFSSNYRHRLVLKIPFPDQIPPFLVHRQILQNITNIKNELKNIKLTLYKRNTIATRYTNFEEISVLKCEFHFNSKEHHYATLKRIPVPQS